MIPLVVVENPKRWPFDIDGVEVVPARQYLVDPHYAELRRGAVYNVCRAYGYQTIGYYVSLLAAARGHRPLPSVATLQALGETALVRLASDELDDEIQSSLAPLRSEEFRLSIYFGKNVAKRYDRLARALFNLFPAPFLRARFTWDERWKLTSLRPIAAGECARSTASSPWSRRATTSPARAGCGDPGSTATRWRSCGARKTPPRPPTSAPSSASSGRPRPTASRPSSWTPTTRGASPSTTPSSSGRPRRSTTTPTAWPRRAAAEGLVVIDHPESIIRCGNKVYQAELFERHNIPCPRTLVVHEGNVDDVAATVGLPCVLKRPDGSFSRGVARVETEDELRALVPDLFRESELLVAQSFVPSSYDWRVGVLDRKPLFVCRYHMATGHWQIVRSEGTETRYGKVETLAVSDAPKAWWSWA